VIERSERSSTSATRCNRFCNHSGTFSDTVGNVRPMQLTENTNVACPAVSVDFSSLDYESVALTIELRALKLLVSYGYKLLRSIACCLANAIL
jgi:hypothetical protein